jgi:hypothetical protein
MSAQDFGFSLLAAANGSSLSSDTLEESGDTACLLDADLTIVYCNPAWDRFALENDGEAATRAHVLGRNLMQFVPDELKPFYDAAFQSARCDIVAFDYECSSPDIYRTFRLILFPQNRTETGYALVHSLRVEEPIAGRRPVLAPGAAYHLPGQPALVCSHCRRTRRVEAPERWDWVPAYLTPGAEIVSHGLCPVCRQYHYPKQRR